MTPDGMTSLQSTDKCHSRLNADRQLLTTGHTGTALRQELLLRHHAPKHQNDALVKADRRKEEFTLNRDAGYQGW
jgi:hypothetical protein